MLDLSIVGVIDINAIRLEKYGLQNLEDSKGSQSQEDIKENGYETQRSPQ